MFLLTSFLVFGALFAESWAEHCDRFHHPGSLYFGKRGRLSLYPQSLFIGRRGELLFNLGLTEEENKAGDCLKMTITGCNGTCTVKSRYGNAEMEGTESGVYRIILTEKGLTTIGSQRAPCKQRRQSVPVSKYVKLSLWIGSATEEGVPKSPKVELLSFGGGTFECIPRTSKTIGEICERRPQCPDDLAKDEEGGFSITLNKDRRQLLSLLIQFESDVDGVELKGINETGTLKPRYIKTKQRCGSLYEFHVVRNRRAARAGEGIKLSFTLDDANGTVTRPAIVFATTKPRSRRSRLCGYTCGRFVGCTKPTTQAPILETTQAPVPETTQAPIVETTPAPTPPPEPETVAPQPETVAPQPETVAPQPETVAPQPATVAPQPETVAPQPETTVPPEEGSGEESGEESESGSETSDVPVEDVNEQLSKLSEVMGDEDFDFDDLW